ncbi:acyl-CoA dehydrogenase family protein [Arthrobacter roseus]|uniref:acyl-CoA dehydrogenase family protein n=1 Tax=Arthrobacter roseus TaxID=136274 RepID=UPI0019669A24|nr:acyl-CoA dehydrogenase family protein [Arthrobacter roseus]MBM7848163.1 alkylation response protein AidB-like acyl-CoA dehydrogenase [Arthrobacter roseus]
MSSTSHAASVAGSASEPHRSFGVRLDPGRAAADANNMEFLHDLYETAQGCRADITALLELARKLGHRLPFPQHGNVVQLWQALATLGAADLTAARIIEPHLDALAILDQADQNELWPEDSTWGVFAAHGPGEQLTATPQGGGWRLNGPKPWCSLAEDLSHALVSAWTEDGMQLFAIDLHHPGVSTSGRPWTALGLPEVPSRGLVLIDVPAVVVGGPGWYIQRPGFAWGGVGIAAIWHGASTSLARRFHRHCLSREPDQIALWHLGSVDQALWSSRTAIQAAAAAADSATEGTPSAEAPALMAARVRATVVAASESVLSLTSHGMGPEPLAFEPEHAQRVADLQLYLRQDHAERSLAVHGKAVLDAASAVGVGIAPW